MTTLSDLPDWLRDGLNAHETGPLDAARERVVTFRKCYSKLTYGECLYILAKEFLDRRRPRAWMVNLLMGRLNRLRNERHADSIAHLKTWVFRARA